MACGKRARDCRVQSGGTRSCGGGTPRRKNLWRQVTADFSLGELVRSGPAVRDTPAFCSLWPPVRLEGHVGRRRDCSPRGRGTPAVCSPRQSARGAPATRPGGLSADPAENLWAIAHRPYGLAGTGAAVPGTAVCAVESSLAAGEIAAASLRVSSGEIEKCNRQAHYTCRESAKCK